MEIVKRWLPFYIYIYIYIYRLHERERERESWLHFFWSSNTDNYNYEFLRKQTNEQIWMSSYIFLLDTYSFIFYTNIGKNLQYFVLAFNMWFPFTKNQMKQLAKTKKWTLDQQKWCRTKKVNEGPVIDQCIISIFLQYWFGWHQWYSCFIRRAEIFIHQTLFILKLYQALDHNFWSTCYNFWQVPTSTIEKLITDEFQFFLNWRIERSAELYIGKILCSQMEQNLGVVF